MPKTKKPRHNITADDQLEADNAIQYSRPIGMKWSENSCAYDSVFMILSNIWRRDHRQWNVAFEQLGNEFCNLLALSRSGI